MDANGQNAALVLAALKESDVDRYLAVLLSPEPKRRSLAALYAYNAELARIRDIVREPLPGEVRLQYWRDLLQGSAHGSSEANPVGSELLLAIERDHLPVAPLVAMSEARIFDLYDDPMEDQASFEGYAGETASALIQLASLVLDADKAPEYAQTAGHAGVAQAVAGALLLLPQHRARGQVYFPAEILSATGFSREQFLSGDDDARLAATISAFAGLGLDHLRKASLSGPITESLMPAYLPAVLARPVLEAAARNGQTAIQGRLRAPQWRRQIRMAFGLWRRKL